MVATRSQRGFTVVELMCAFAVLSVLAVMLVHTRHGHTACMTRAFHETLALRIAQAELEVARARVEQLAAGDGEFELPPDVGPLPGGHGWRSVREVEPQLFEVEVRVRWRPAGANREAGVSLTTRLAGEEAER